MTKSQAGFDDDEFHGFDESETITRGSLVSQEKTTCERCGDILPVGTRTYLIGRIGPVDVCCRYCAMVDGADEDLLDGNCGDILARRERRGFHGMWNTSNVLD